MVFVHQNAVIPLNGILFHSKTISKQNGALQANQTKVIQKMGNLLWVFLLLLSSAVFILLLARNICIWPKANELCELENKWKWSETYTLEREKEWERENRKEENKNIKWSSEWEKEKAIAWMDWATANNVNNFISSLFLSPQLNAEESWESFSSFYVITLRLVSLFFSIIPFFLTFPFLFVASFFAYLVSWFYFSSPFMMRIPFGHSHICC